MYIDKIIVNRYNTACLNDSTHKIYYIKNTYTQSISILDTSRLFRILNYKLIRFHFKIERFIDKICNKIADL